MKAKFAHMFVRDGCVFGLDDGIFACVDLDDGLAEVEGRTVRSRPGVAGG